MARWDEILSLLVHLGIYCLLTLCGQRWKVGITKSIVIPFARVNDFVKGESKNKDCPSRFHVEARRRQSPDMTCKPKVDGILEYIL